MLLRRILSRPSDYFSLWSLSFDCLSWKMNHRRTFLVATTYFCLANEGVVNGLISTENHSVSHFWSEDVRSRRCLFRQACRAAVSTPALIIAPFGASAEEDAMATMAQQNSRAGKPYAPKEALLPAARFKVWIDRAYSISSQLSPYVGDDNDKESAFRLLEELDKVLSARPNLFTNKERPLQRNAFGATAQITASVSSANKSQYKQNRENLSIPNKMAAIFNQADVERQWGMLQYAESNREKENPVRAAFNYYTQQLVFDGDSYLLTASKEEKKKMIRSGQGLPSLTAVITSDLDLRDLYRNQLLTAIDDAVAEVAYQAKLPRNEIDLADTVSLMNQAHTACDNWFALIPKEDLEEALNSISSEG